jgi:hypothetical protein
MRRFTTKRLDLSFASVAALCAFATVGCAGTTDQAELESSAASESAITVPAGAGAASLGSGYDIEREQVLADCVTGPLEPINTGNGTIGVIRNLTQDELKTELDVAAGGKAAFGPFSVNAGAKFALNVANNSYSETALFTQQVAGLRYRIRDAQLTPRASGAITADPTGGKFREMCGTDFIESTELGAKLFVAVRFDFADDSVKSDFEAHIKLDYLSLFSVEGSVKTAYERYSNSLTVTISAYQMGGNPADLGRILGGVTADGNTTGAAALTCSLSKLDDCKTTLVNIGRYMGTDFRNQIANTGLDQTLTDPHALPTGLARLTYETKSYKNAGLPVDVDSPIVQAAVRVARERIFDRYQQIVRDRKRADALLNSGDFRLDAVERAAITDALVKLNRQGAEAAEVGLQCYSDALHCPQLVDPLLAKFDSDPNYYVDPSVLVKELGYFELCKSAAKTPEVTKTLNAIASYLAIDDGSCADKADEVENATVIDIAGTEALKLSDLRPLRSAKKLHFLRLPNHAVRNVGPLAKLPALESLNLRANGLASVLRLGSLAKLKELNIADNNIRDIGPLVDIKTLEVIKAQGNPIADPSVLDGLPALRVKIFNNNDICRVERDALRDAGTITDRDYTTNTRRNWAPIYNVPGSRPSGIQTWAACAAVASKLPAGF